MASIREFAPSIAEEIEGIARGVRTADRADRCAQRPHRDPCPRRPAHARRVLGCRLARSRRKPGCPSDVGLARGARGLLARLDDPPSGRTGRADPHRARDRGQDRRVEHRGRCSVQHPPSRERREGHRRPRPRRRATRPRRGTRCARGPGDHQCCPCLGIVGDHAGGDRRQRRDGGYRRGVSRAARGSCSRTSTVFSSTPIISSRLRRRSVTGSRRSGRTASCATTFSNAASPTELRRWPARHSLR